MLARTKIVLLGVLISLAIISRGAISASAGIVTAPTITGPEDGATLTSFAPALMWTNPTGATQYQVQVTPFNNDGPAVDLHIGSAGTRFIVPPPPFWYGLLPDMTYTWRIRVSDASTFVGLADASWSPWATARFKTTAVDGSTITAYTPAQDDVVNTSTPTLQWKNSRSDVFYYDLQLSKDAAFNADPATAIAMIYGATLHGGISNPLSSYAIPIKSPLEDKATYYWRVRPRVQGDGTPAAWSAAFSFKTDFLAAPPMIIQPASFSLNEVNPTTCDLSSASTFASTPVMTGVNYGYNYSGSGIVSHNFYLNDMQYTAAVRELPASGTCVTGSVGIPGGAHDVGPPLKPGTYRIDVWAQGQKLQTSSFVVTSATEFAISPLAVGTNLVNPASCTLSGVSTTVPASSKYLFLRFNYVGQGAVTHGVWNGSVKVAEFTTPLTLAAPAACVYFYLESNPSFDKGSYRWDVASGGKVIATANFTVN